MMNRIKLDNLTDRMIEIIRKRPGHLYSWDRLAARLTIEPERLPELTARAIEWDYTLRVQKGTGLAFVAPPDLLTATEINYNLRTRWLGHTVYAYQSVKSTNDVAVKMIEKGAPEGALVTAEEQTKGRGRLGRPWVSPLSSGIYLSVILRPALPPADAPGLAIMTAIALADTVSSYRPGLVQIKWPNDVWIDGRKTAGILTELSAETNRINHVVIGVGVNVNLQARDFPEELKTIATSLRRVLRRKIDRVEFVRKFLVNLELEYGRYLRTRLSKSQIKLRKYSALIGHEVTLAFGKNRKTGLVKDIDRTGALMLQTDSGLETITAGEVTVIKE